MRGTLLCGLLGITSWVGCGNIDRPKDTQTTGPTGTMTSTNPDPVVEPGRGGPAGETPETLTDLFCPGKPVSLLVLDLRSGWWMGDGDDFYKIALNQLSQTCDDVSIEYYHFFGQERCLWNGAPCVPQQVTIPTTAAGLRTLFAKPSWADYSQVWVLAGEDLGEDLVQAFAALLKDVLADDACTPMFLGAGMGHATYANLITKEIGLGDAFIPVEYDGTTYYPPVRASTIMKAGTHLADHLLFKDVPAIADTIEMFGSPSRGDSLLASVPNVDYNIVATDTSGRPSIALANIGALAKKVPIVLDAGIQRYWAMQDPAVPGTGKLLSNILQYLSLVGCKGDYVAPPIL